MENEWMMFWFENEKNDILMLKWEKKRWKVSKEGGLWMILKG